MDDLEAARFKIPVDFANLERFKNISGGIIDSHAHLLKEFYEQERDLVIERMMAMNVRQIISPGIDMKSIPELIDLAQRYDNIFIGIGLHPHQANEWDEAACATMKDHITHNKVVAVGECGLDFFYNNSPPAQQILAFKEQLKIARQFNKPVIIHCRDAWEELLTILDGEGKGMKGVLHCFTGDERIVERLRKLVDFDAYISFSGIVTFPKATGVQAAAKIVDDDKILVETDCPFLAPQAVRGQRNEPAYVWFVAEKLAQLREQTLAEIASLSAINARRLFAF